MYCVFAVRQMLNQLLSCSPSCDWICFIDFHTRYNFHVRCSVIVRVNNTICKYTISKLHM